MSGPVISGRSEPRPDPADDVTTHDVWFHFLDTGDVQVSCFTHDWSRTVDGTHTLDDLRRLEAMHVTGEHVTTEDILADMQARLDEQGFNR